MIREVHHFIHPDFKHNTIRPLARCLRVADVITFLPSPNHIRKRRQIINLTPDTIIHRHHQALFIVTGRAPLLKRLGRAYLPGNPVMKKIIHRLLRPQTAGASKFVLGTLDLFAHLIESVHKPSTSPQAAF